MNFLKLCIREPVIAIVLSLVLIVLGVAAYSRLNMNYLPTIKVPVVTISTSFTGAPASIMESKVTNLIENQLGSVDGVQSIASSSSDGSSSITVNFKLGGDFDQEVNMVRDKVNAATADSNWPADANRPSVTVGMQGGVVMVLAFTDPSKSTDDMRDYLINTISKQFTQIPGVASANVKGGSTFAMRVWLDPAKMAGLSVTVGDIEAKLAAENIDISGGSIQAPGRSYGIVSHTRFKNPQDFENMVIAQTPQAVVRLSDVAHIEFASSSIDVSPMRINSKDSTFVLINPAQGVNPLQLDNALKSKLADLQSSLLPGMNMNLVEDNTDFLRSSIDESFKTIFEAITLVVIIVILFLGSLRASIIPIITIPVSLIAVFAIIYLLGFSINVMSLLALVLAIGLVVDDAIVMLENIHRHIENGMNSMAAAVQGCKEIAGPVIAMGLTLVAVYAPIGMVQGVTAILFKQFAFTLAAAVLISAFIALTLSPMMCSKILVHDKNPGWFMRSVESFFAFIAKLYKLSLAGALKARFIVVCILIIVAAFGVVLFKMLPAQLLPQEDQGQFNIQVRAPAGSRLSYTDPYVIKIEKLALALPDVRDVVTLGSASSPFLMVYLKPWQGRNYTPKQLIAKIQPQLDNITGVTASAFLPQLYQTTQQTDAIDFNIMTNGSYKDLMPAVNSFTAALKSYPGLTNIYSNLQFDAQQYSIDVNRDLAAQSGVSMQDISDTMGTMLGSKHTTDVASGQKSYSVLLQMQEKDLSDFDVLNKLYVRSSSGPNVGKLFPLSSLVKLTPSIGQSSLAHFNRMRSALVTAQLAGGTVESQAIAAVQQIAAKTLPPGIATAFSGKAQQYLDSSGTMLGIVCLSFVFIYLVLAAQFRSFVDPLAILLAVPLSMVGAAFMLWLVGGTLNLYSEVGMVTLIGLISKHGILITQFTNQKIKSGLALHDALLEAASIRLRPILMTTAAMVFGTLPLVMATGPGAAGRQEIGAVLVGGLLLGTFFSLFVVPVAYSYLSVLKPKKQITELDDV